MIDTPGYPDFIGQAIGAMRGVDTAAIVINAQAGIEVNTRRVFAEAGKAGLGRMIVINKMDADNIDFPALVDSIQELFGKACVLLNVPLGQGADFRGVASTLKPPADAAGALVDPGRDQRVAARVDHRGRRGGDGAVLRGHAADRRGDLRRLIVKAVAQGTSDPDRLRVGQDGRGRAGAARRAGAVRAAARRGRRARRRTPAGEEVEVKADPAGPLVAQVFKTRIDPFVQKLSFIRVFSGTLKKDATVPVVGVAQGGQDRPSCFDVQADETAADRRGRPGRDRGRGQGRRPAHRHVAGRADDAADPVPHADGRPGRHAQEPRRRRQALRRAAQDRRGRLDLPAATATRRPRKWSSPA